MADKQIYTFTNTIDEVEIISLGAKITVLSTEGTALTAEYDNPKDKPEICAVLCGNKLTLKETLGLHIFCGKPDGDYAITVTLPNKLYKLLKINTASGGVEITDSAVTAEKFSLSTASGDIRVSAFFENVKVNTASGNITLSNPFDDNTAQSVDISTASGDILLENYKAEKFSINSISGKTVYNNASGAGNIHVTSGEINVNYGQWDGDLKIGAVSGRVNVTLPEDSGANIKFDGVSGTVRTDLNGAAGGFINLGKGTNGEFGGANKHNININLVSGTVTVSGSGGAEVEFVEEKAEA